MPRVFVIEEPNRHVDLTPAEKFGEVLFIYDRFSRRPSVFEPDEYVTDVRKRLKTYGFSSDDYFCFVGATLNVSLTLLALSDRENLKVLMYDAGDHAYRERTIKGDKK